MSQIICNYTACSDCFKNEGIRIEARNIGCKDNSLCMQCGLQSGHKLTASDCEELVDAFFVQGTIPPDCGGGASLYMANEYEHEECVASLYIQDFRFLKRITKLNVFHNGPPIWKLGYTTYMEKIFENDASVYEDIIRRCAVKTLNVDYKLYRARLNISGDPFDHMQYDSPPSKKNYDRFDSKEVSIMYCSKDVESCIHECKTTLVDNIYIATIYPVTQLRVVDLTDIIEEDWSELDFSSIYVTLRHLVTKTNTNEYCRKLSMGIKKLGFDGFICKSYYSLIKKNEPVNVCLFGNPVRERKVRVESVNTARITQIDMNYTMGPIVNYG